MSSKEEKMEVYMAQLNELGVETDTELLNAIVNHLGPANYDNDASLVACSDKTERERVVKSFIHKKLAVAEGAQDSVDNACTKMQGMKNKQRAVFYYLVTKELKAENKF